MSHANTKGTERLVHKNEPVLGRTLLSWFGHILLPEPLRVCRLEMNQIEKVKEFHDTCDQ